MLAFFLEANYFPNGKNCLAITVTFYQTSSMKFPPNMVGWWDCGDTKFTLNLVGNNLLFLTVQGSLAEVGAAPLTAFPVVFQLNL